MHFYGVYHDQRSMFSIFMIERSDTRYSPRHVFHFGLLRLISNALLAELVEKFIRVKKIFVSSSLYVSTLLNGPRPIIILA